MLFFFLLEFESHFVHPLSCRDACSIPFVLIVECPFLFCFCINKYALKLTLKVTKNHEKREVG